MGQVASLPRVIELSHPVASTCAAWVIPVEKLVICYEVSLIQLRTLRRPLCKEIVKNGIAGSKIATCLAEGSPEQGGVCKGERLSMKMQRSGSKSEAAYGWQQLNVQVHHKFNLNEMHMSIQVLKPCMGLGSRA